MVIEQASREALSALALGFAFAGFLASGYEVLVRRPLSIRLLQTGGLAALASVPVLVFSAPALIIRGTLRAARGERRPFGLVFAATVVAGVWSLLSGRLVFDLALRLLHA